jgi:AmmeMemoRadiSam system protein B
MSIRQPAVAGMFYPGDAKQLRLNVESLLGEVGGRQSQPTPKALIVPHAGYVYSGAVAARAYQLLQGVRESIERVVLLGPAHRVYLEGMAVPEAEVFATPLGEVPLDVDAIAAISGLPGVCRSDAAHADEHSLEVQLPFLQTVLADFRLVPVVVGQCDADRVAAVIDALWGGPETLIVISSDLSHFLSYREAREVDGNTCRRILDKDSRLSGDEACGANAINGLMRCRHCTDLSIEAVDLRNSGDTAGDRSRVVGYGAFALH